MILVCHDVANHLSYVFPYIRLLIITMTERIMYSEKHAEYIKKNKKNEKQLILVMNVSTLVYITYVQ